MILDQIDYKGKWFILQDKGVPGEYGMDFILDEVEVDNLDDLLLIEHIEACDYYGIPAYIGDDAEFKKRIESIKKLNYE